MKWSQLAETVNCRKAATAPGVSGGQVPVPGCSPADVHSTEPSVKAGDRPYGVGVPAAVPVRSPEMWGYLQRTAE